MAECSGSYCIPFFILARICCFGTTFDDTAKFKNLKDFKEEKEMLRRTLENDNYPNWLIKKTFNRFKFNKIEKQEKSKNEVTNNHVAIYNKAF